MHEAIGLRAERFSPGAGAPDADAVGNAFERLLANAEFDASPRSRDVLRHVVEEAMAGRAEHLKQSEIAR